MPYYVEVLSENYGKVTASTGSKQVADRLHNIDTACAGEDFCYVYQFGLSFSQPHDEVGGGTHSAAPFIHRLELVLPDYEPMISVLLNVLNNHDRVSRLVLNTTKRRGSGTEVVIQQYVMEDGMVVDFRHDVLDQRQGEHLRHRGEVRLALKFQRLSAEDRVNHTSGLATTNKAA